VKRKAGLALPLVRDPHERDCECVERVGSEAGVAAPGRGNPARADHLHIRIAQAASPHALGEDPLDLGLVERHVEAQPAHTAQEPLHVVGEPEERAAPDVDDVVGRVRAEQPPIEDRYAGLLDRYELAVYERHPCHARTIRPPREARERS
jgi:hypothetical protein